jgi:hypothetical protein
MSHIDQIEAAVNRGNVGVIPDARRQRMTFWAKRLKGLAEKAAEAATIIEAETRALAPSHSDGWLLDDAEHLRRVSTALVEALSDGGAE